MAHIALSPLDQERFQIPSARAYDMSVEQVDEVLDFCRANQVQFLVARCPAADIQAAQRMEHEGFRLMDTLVYWKRHLHKTPISADPGLMLVRPAQQEDRAAVRSVAEAAFNGYFGHYHADPRLDTATCDDIYISWAERSVLLREVAQEVLVAEQNGQIIGFLTLRMNSTTEGTGPLIAVAPFAQGQGCSRSLMLHGLSWCATQGASTMIMSTQLINTASQKVWARVGFEFSHADYTFHKWFDYV